MTAQLFVFANIAAANIDSMFYICKGAAGTVLSKC